MNKPEFNDAFAKTKRKYYKSFEGYVVEVLYGAKDENGNPCEARAEAEDGHGTWSGIEINGDYTMFSWKHSADEGGNIEYGTSHEDHALEDLRADLEKKKELARNAEILSRDYEGEDAETKMEALKAEWDAVENWNTPVDAELANRFDKAMAEYGPKVEALAANKTLKQDIMAKAEELKNSVNFKDAWASLNALKAELRNIGSAGSEIDASARHTLSDAEKDIRTRQDAYFADRDANIANAAAKKQEIIEQAKQTLAAATNWKAAGDKMNALLDEWKKAGFAGRETDDSLWSAFNEVRQEFRTKRQAYFDERKKQWEASEETKRALIAKAAEISASGDYGRKNTDAMKQLDIDWKKAGYSGKDNNDALWEEFNNTKEQFWDNKRAAALKKVQAGLETKKEEKAALEKKIEDLEYRITIAPNPAIKEDVERELYIRRNELQNLEEEIEDEEKKFSE